MSEDKMRLDSRAAAIKACTDSYEQKLAIKDAEIVAMKQNWQELRNVLEQTQKSLVAAEKEVASHDLTIKELQCQLVDTRATLLGLQPDFGGPIAAQMGKAVLRINEALANSEHHNSKALEKMLLVARLDELTDLPEELLASRSVSTRAEELAIEIAELNKE